MFSKWFLLIAALCAGPCLTHNSASGAARNLPLVFEPATRPGALDFTARRPGYTLLLARGEVAVVSSAGAARLRFAGANPHAAAAGIGELPGRLNYLIGRDPARWRSGVSAFTRVRYREIYPGVDLEYYGSGGELEYDLVVAPRADPAAIVIAVEGRGPLTVDARGDLVMGSSQLLLRRPVLYQEIGGGRREITGGYAIRGRDRAGFHIGEYDRTKPLIIDPVLIFSTYLGGHGDENLPGASDDLTTGSVAVDAGGNVYVAGNTASLDFPTANPLQAKYAGAVDVFVAKLDPSGSKLLYCTYLGGSDTDRAFGIAVDASGSAYVAGRTVSANFPATANAYQKSMRSPSDAFIAKLSPDGGSLVYATYLGGSNNDDITAVAVDSAGAAYVTGETQSADFPVVNAAQPRFGGRFDGFVAKLNPQGSALVYATYLGGSQGDDVQGIAVDSRGNAYVTGYTSSTDFPVLNPIQNKLASTNGSNDAFIAKLDASGVLMYSTYFGGSEDELGTGIAVDAAGSAYVTGPTISKDFPVTSDAEQKALSGAEDGFLVKLNPSGSAASYSSYFGGPGNELAIAVGLDAAGTVYVCGGTTSTTFQNFPGAVQPAYGGGPADAFLAKFDPASLRLAYFTYLGGGDIDGCQALAVDAAGNILVEGLTYSTNFPTTGAAVQRAYGGATTDAFIAKIAIAPAISPSISRVNVAGGGTDIAQNTWIEIHGAGLAPASVGAGLDWSTAPEFASGRMPAQLQGVSVKVNGKPAYVYFISPAQVNVLTPLDSATGPVQLQLTNGSNTSDPFTVNLKPVAPAFLQFGAGPYIAAEHGDYSLLGPASLSVPGYTFTPAQPGETILLFGAGFGLPSSILTDGSSTQSSTLPTLPQITIGGVPANVVSAWVISPGLYQFNVVVPATAAAGDNAVAATYLGATTSGAVRITVGR